MVTTKKEAVDFEKQLSEIKNRPDFESDLKHHDDRGELDLTRLIDSLRAEIIDLKSKLVEKESLLKGTRGLVEDYLKAGYKYAARVKDLENISKQHQKQVGELMVENKFHKEKTKHFENRCAELLEDNKKLAQQIDDLTNIKNKGEFGK